MHRLIAAIVLVTMLFSLTGLIVSAGQFHRDYDGTRSLTVPPGHGRKRHDP
jgi:hypothetical protein